MRPADADAAPGLRDEHPRHPQRPDAHEDVGVEGDEVTDLEVAVDHQVAAVPEDHHQRDRRQEVEERQEARSQPRRLQRAVEDRVGLRFESLDLELLGPEALHHTDAGDRLLDDAGHVAQLLLQLEHDRCDPLREAGRRDVEERQHPERQQRQRDALQHHHDDDRGHDEERRGEERQQDDDGVDLLDVGVGPRHELAGLGLVVEREVQPLEVRRTGAGAGRSRRGTRCGTRRSDGRRCRTPAPRRRAR